MQYFTMGMWKGSRGKFQTLGTSKNYVGYSNYCVDANHQGPFTNMD